MRYVLTFLFSLVLAVGLTGCDSNDNGGPGPTAEVRFMHASPGAGPVNVVVDGDEALSGVSFSSEITNPTVSDYQDVPVSADAEIEVQSAADGSTVLSTTAGEANLQEDNQYTVIVAGAPSSNAPQLIVLRDQFRDDLGDTEIGLRLVHGAAGLPVPAVDIYLNEPGTDLSGDDPLVSGFQFGDDFPGQFPGQFAAQSVSSSGSELVVTASGSTDPVLTLDVGTGDQGSLEVQPGQHITGVAIDGPSALVHIDNPSN